MRLKLLADPPERNAWSQAQNLSEDKPLFEARRNHYRRRSRKGIISMNIHMETTCSARGTLTWRGVQPVQMAPPVTQIGRSATRDMVEKCRLATSTVPTINQLESLGGVHAGNPGGKEDFRGAVACAAHTSGGRRNQRKRHRT